MYEICIQRTFSDPEHVLDGMSWAHVVATSDTYDEALRIADAFTRKDRTLHTVRKAS